ncbi:glutamyl-tRNA reductase [Actinomyces sp. Marseille-P3109]|uniref:glutamyl-tRNA reductase n=1 Tax=Actinomyces sp. Marseille-P3109 TaxID=2083009 RepID=UPI000D54B385|nr:glutamyl-tRNA reductase [Actinomyces sp. Marseille-P3109]
MTTHLLSADHRLPGLDVVARLGAVASGLGTALMAAVPALRGVVVLSTCNRLALLVDADSWADTGCPAALDSTTLHAGSANPTATTEAAAGAGPAAPSDLGQTISDLLAERAGLTPSGLHLSHLVGAAARREMLAIAAGLSSMVVGEGQIVGQVRRAAEAAAAEGTLSPELVRIIERASATARRVAHETELSGQGRSIVAVGVDQAADHLPPLDGCRALIVGTGSYAGATVAALRARGLTDIAVYSASNRAETFAAGHDLRAVPAGALSGAMSRTDLVVTCRGTGRPILTADVVAPVAADRAAGRPLVILDLALTHDVDEAVGALPGVVHLDLAGVRDAVPDAEAEQVASARAIVDAEAVDFERSLAGRAMDPLITALRAQVGRVVAEEAARLRPQPARRPALAVPAVDGRAGTGAGGVNSADAAAGACPHRDVHAEPGLEIAMDADGEQMISLAQAERALHHLAARLLHQPTVMARRAGQEGREEAYRQALELVWGLETTGDAHD